MVLTTKLVAGAVAAAGALIVFISGEGGLANSTEAAATGDAENKQVADAALVNPGPPPPLDFACQSNCDLWRMFAPH